MKTEKKNNNNNNNICSSQLYLKILHNYRNRKNRESTKNINIKCSNSDIYKNSSIIPYSIKPLFCSVPKDVNLHEIFVNMMNSSFKINNNKSIYLKMTEKELDIRNYILNCIKIFTFKNGFQKKEFCSIIFLYDVLIVKNMEKKIVSNPEEIAIGAMILTLKFLCGKKKFMNSIKNFSRLFKNEILNQKDVNLIEIDCLKLLGYYLSFATPISFMDIFFINGIIFSTDKINTNNSSRIYELVIDIIEKIMILSNEYIKYNPLCLCSCIVSLAREIYNLEKWPPILTQAFGVSFTSFENIYNEFYELVFPKENNNDEIKEENKNKNKHKKLNSNAYNGEIDDNLDKNEMKLHTSSSVVENLITSRYKTPIKMNGEKPKNFSNIYYNQNFNFNKKYYHNRNNGTDIYNKNPKNKFFKNSNGYCNDKDITADNLELNSKRVEEIELPKEIDKKNGSLKYLYETKQNENYNNNKINKKIVNNKNKEEDYSNVATSDNSSNYIKSNIKVGKKKYDKKYENIDNNYDENYIDIKGNDLYQSTVLPNSTQRRYHKNYPRWGSNKKFKIKNGNSTKESFFPFSESKSIYVKRVINNKFE